MLDEEESVFAAFEVYHRSGLFVVDGVEVNRWLGTLSEREFRRAFERAVV